jgi:hypothetical protein
MFALTWPIDLSNSGKMPFHVPFLIYLFLGWGFVIASVAMTGWTLGRAAVVALPRRFLVWRVAWKWHVVAFLMYPTTFASAIFLDAAFRGTAVDFSVFAHRIFGAELYTWLYNNTRGSLLLSVSLHASGNTAGVFLPVANTVTGAHSGALLIQVGLELLVAIVVIVTAGPARLSRTEPKQVQE